MFIKVTNYLAPNFATEDFRIQVRGSLANYDYGCHVTPVTRGALGYVSYKKGIIQGYLVQRYTPRKATVLCSRIVFWGCTFTRCKYPGCFPILHVRKVYFEALFLMFLVSM